MFLCFKLIRTNSVHGVEGFLKFGCFCFVFVIFGAGMQSRICC